MKIDPQIRVEILPDQSSFDREIQLSKEILIQEKAKGDGLYWLLVSGKRILSYSKTALLPGEKLFGDWITKSNLRELIIHTRKTDIIEWKDQKDPSIRAKQLPESLTEFVKHVSPSSNSAADVPDRIYKLLSVYYSFFSWTPEAELSWFQTEKDVFETFYERGKKNQILLRIRGTSGWNSNVLMEWKEEDGSDLGMFWFFESLEMYLHCSQESQRVKEMLQKCDVKLKGLSLLYQPNLQSKGWWG